MPLTCLDVVKQGGITGNVDAGKSTTGNATIKYHVYFNQDDATPFDAVRAKTADGTKWVPLYFVAYGPYFLKSKSAEQDIADPCKWEVTCSYEIPQIDDQEPRPVPAEGEEPAERWSISIGIKSIPFEVETQFDRAGKMVVNAAGDPITGNTRTVWDNEISIAFTCNEVDDAGIAACKDCINISPVTMTINGQSRVFAAKTLRFTSYQESYTIDPGDQEKYPRVNYTLLHRETGWTRQLANKGFNMIVGGVKQPVTDALGNPVTTPVYLNAAGGTLTAGADVVKVPVENYNEVYLSTLLLWDVST